MAMSTRKKVEIYNEVWLETLKFFMGTQWLKVRFVSRQLAEMVEGNISKLARIKIDSVKFWETSGKPSVLKASNVDIPSNEKLEWFMKRGINLDEPADLKLHTAFIGKKEPYGYHPDTSIYYYAEVNEIDEALEFNRTKGKTIWQRQNADVIFFAEFNPVINEYSWPSLEYFLSLIYSPFTYIEKVEMYALNKNLTDALFLGEDYGSYIHCGKFTLKGDFCKSLPWIQRNVRADTIYFPGNVENSYVEISNLVLGMPWKCAKNKIKLGMVCHWKWFVKILIKKFRTLSTIEHLTNELPSFEFSFCSDSYGIPNLNFLDWYLEVKTMPYYPQGSQTVYVVSNGKNRMEIDISQMLNPMNAQFLRNIYDISVKTYTIQPAAITRETVHILSDTWLETLKFLKFPQWSQTLFVSRQIAGVVQRNISRLPCFVIDSATINEVMSVAPFVSFGDKTPENLKKEFFTDLGISLDAPANVQHKDAVIGLTTKNLSSSIHSVEVCLRDTVHDMNPYKTPCIFSGQFSTHKEYSWAALKYFLKVLYYPASYVKEIEMFVLNQKMVDTVLDDEERFISCGSFTLKRALLDADGLYKSLIWLERNVRANTIHFPEHIDYKNENIYEPIARFLLDASWKCARQEVNIKCICNMESFLQALVEKFRSVSFVRNDIPTFTASTYGDENEPETMSFLLLDPYVLKLKSDDSQCAAEYLIFNGDNRMQIEILKGDKSGFHGCQLNDYTSHMHHNHGSYLFHIFVKVYTV
ncbi:hypothetical protein Ddc_21423 [Ditylenchus destructor]|nr:hypothetical protein Ddc_21423 [Ditylenchus destructor]